MATLTKRASLRKKRPNSSTSNLKLRGLSAACTKNSSRSSNNNTKSCMRHLRGQSVSLQTSWLKPMLTSRRHPTSALWRMKALRRTRIVAIGLIAYSSSNKCCRSEPRTRMQLLISTHYVSSVYSKTSCPLATNSCLNKTKSRSILRSFQCYKM